jgi:hypothetical protein
MTRRTDRRLALLAGGALALLFTMIAAVQVAAWSVGKVERTSHRVLAGPVDELLVTAANGDVTVVRSSDGKVRVDGRSRGHLHAPAPSIDVIGTRVHVAANCPVWGFGECHSEVVVQVPPDTAVRVKSRSGDIVAEGLAGGADLETTSGDVSADGLAGDVALETASGDVVARNLTSPMAKAKSASGEVDLRFTTPPRAAEAITSSGDARILVPPGTEAYNVSVDSDSGNTDTGVRTDPRSSRFLRAETRSGDATVDYGG